MWEFESSQVELAVQLTKFSALAAGKLGMPSPHCPANRLIVWGWDRCGPLRSRGCGQVCRRGSILRQNVNLAELFLNLLDTPGAAGVCNTKSRAGTRDLDSPSKKRFA